jgi:phage/plasmid primase-like uncharacterized protein
MVKRASLDVHPYLMRKAFRKRRGLVLDGDLLIPMREFKLYRQVNSLQRISADGSKLFLPGGKAKGSVFFIGPLLALEKGGWWKGMPPASACALRCASYIVRLR